ncbi:hypothetical protein ACFL5A_04325 [Gemmatimonadota bacterium]
MPKTLIRTTLFLLAVAAFGGCASKTAPLSPGEGRGAIPDLRGRQVLVFPVQLQQGVPRGTLPDAELAHALRSRGAQVLWSFPPDVERALSRSPGVTARMRDLPVGFFLLAEVERVGDPIYGEIRRLGALTGADVALLPIELRYGEEGAYRLTVALIGVQSGRVGWFGVVQGEAGGAEDPASLASMADALARAILPLG